MTFPSLWAGGIVHVVHSDAAMQHCLILGVLSLVKCLPFETAAAAPLRGFGGIDRTWVAWGQTR